MKTKWKLSDAQKDMIPEMYRDFGGRISPIQHFFQTEFGIVLDHSTVCYHVKKRGDPSYTPPVRRERTTRRTIVVTARYKRQDASIDFDGEKLNAGHDYAYYLKTEAQKRKNRMFHSRVISVVSCEEKKGDELA